MFALLEDNGRACGRAGPGAAALWRDVVVAEVDAMLAANAAEGCPLLLQLVQLFVDDVAAVVFTRYPRVVDSVVYGEWG